MWKLSSDYNLTCYISPFPNDNLMLTTKGRCPGIFLQMIHFLLVWIQLFTKCQCNLKHCINIPLLLLAFIICIQN